MQEESEPKLRNPEMEGSRKPTTEPPSTALAYQDPHYWNERFSKEEHYEWFKDYSHFRHLIQAHIPPTSSVVTLSLSCLLLLGSFIYFLLSRIFCFYCACFCDKKV
jgi:hypothetical protein